MDLLYQVLILIFTPTSVVAILAFILKKYFENTIAKDLEEYKNQLKLRTTEFQIKFSYLHEKKAKVYSTFYSYLVQTIRAVEDLVRPIRMNNPIIIDQKNITVDKFNQTSAYFYENRLFFDSDLIHNIESVLNDIKESIIEFDIAQPGKEIEHGPDNDPQLWISSYRRIQNNVRPVLEEIENKFREFFQNN